MLNSKYPKSVTSRQQRYRHACMKRNMHLALAQEYPQLLPFHEAKAEYWQHEVDANRGGGGPFTMPRHQVHQEDYHEHR